MFKGRTPAVGSWWKMACVHGPYLLPLRVCSGTSRWIVENGENPTWYQVRVYIYLVWLTACRLGRRSVDLLLAAHRTKTLQKPVVGRIGVVGRDFGSHVHHENAF